MSETHNEVALDKQEDLVVAEEEAGEEEAGEEEATEEETDVVESLELSEEEWDVQIHGEETDAQKIVRLRKEANDLIRRARELELSLPQPVTLEHSENSDMREIDGIMYRVEETFLYNRYDELVGFIEKDDEVTFTTGWDSARGIWAYEATDW